MPIFRVKSVKIYTGQKKIYTGAARGTRDKYEVNILRKPESIWSSNTQHTIFLELEFKMR